MGVGGAVIGRSLFLSRIPEVMKRLLSRLEEGGKEEVSDES